MKNDPGAGRNRGAVAVGMELKPGANCCYFVGITDGNAGGNGNICVFQPHQFFRTA